MLANRNFTTFASVLERVSPSSAPSVRCDEPGNGGSLGGLLRVDHEVRDKLAWRLLYHVSYLHLQRPCQWGELPVLSKDDDVLTSSAVLRERFIGTLAAAALTPEPSLRDRTIWSTYPT